MSKILEELRQSIIEGDDEDALNFVKVALEQGVEPVVILNNSIISGINEAGRLWNENRYFLPDVILSAGAFRAALDVVEPQLTKKRNHGSKRILLGVVAGDMHDLGKTIVIAMLSGSGFEVIDLGVDVSLQTFIDKTKELEPDIIGLGAYMTTTMLLMKDIIDSLVENNLRDKVKVLVGGVPTSQKFADEIGADGWGKDALESVGKAKELAGVK